MMESRDPKSPVSLTRLTIPAMVMLLAAAPAVGWQVRLRNDLSPGALAIYTVSITGQRTGRFGPYEEKLSYEQSGRLTQLVAEAASKDMARRAWMLELQPANVVSLTRDDQNVEDVPEAKTVGLPPRAVQLRVGEISSQTAPAYPVGGSAVQRAALLLALDFARWPDSLVDEGQSWEQPADRPEFDGVWTHRYTSSEGRGSQRLAVGEFQFDGHLTGPLEGAAQIVQARGTWKWRVAKRALAAATADVILEYNQLDDPKTLHFAVKLDLDRLDRLPKEQVAQAAAQISELSDLANEADLGSSAPGENESAQSRLQAFIDTHPDSLWLSLARHLRQRAEVDLSAFSGIEHDRMVDVLTRLVTRWQQLALANQSEPLQPLRATLRQLARLNREVVYELADGADRNVRAMAVFCIAFGDQPADLQKVLSLCEDDEPRVRAWAAYGLAERRDPSVSVDVLIRLLGDDNQTVRYRGAQAIRTCVNRESDDRNRMMSILLDRVKSEPFELAREQIALAIDHLAEADDLEKLIRAESEQDVPPVRRILEATIRRLGGKPADPAG